MTLSAQPSADNQQAPQPIITLLTDFGLTDGYIAGMKGVMLGICPSVRFVDISHLVPPQDIRSGAYILSTVYRDFPEGTIHLAVVDPGVGTARRALAMRSERYFFVGPDNGVFSWILKRESSCESRNIENARYQRAEVSRTFHGRDVFAPAAAHLASGSPFGSFGPLCTPILSEWTSVSLGADDVRGEIIHIDRFGNAITNVTGADLADFAPQAEWLVQIGETSISSVAGTYGEVGVAMPLVLIGSSGHLEIAVSQENAAKVLGLSTGNPVSVKRRVSGMASS